MRPNRSSEIGTFSTSRVGHPGGQCFQPALATNLATPPSFIDLDTTLAIFETGIKVLDALAVSRTGDLMRVPVGNGTPDCVLCESSWINNIAKAHNGVSVFCGEGNDLYTEMCDFQDNLAESKVSLVYGQMNEPPGASGMRAGLSALTVAEYFRDVIQQDGLLFVQAGSEVSALLGRLPSAVGYQPTLGTEMGCFRDVIQQDFLDWIVGQEHYA